MPVTRISDSVDWSANAGASAWIGATSVWPIGPRSSIGSPITFIIRPSVLGPTGTEICAPVSVTTIPRTKPSVLSIAMVRTEFSPRCCATSRTRRLPLLSNSRADKIDGKSPSNLTSTTAPITWDTRPLLCLVIILYHSRGARPASIVN